MTLDLGAPARGLADTLNPGGALDAANNRAGGTFPGTVAALQNYQPVQPYGGPTPAVFVSSIPLVAHISFEGAGCHRVDGTLELYYVDRLSQEQGVALGLIDQEMTGNCTAIVNAILGDLHLSDSVMAVTQPIEVVRDPEGIFREWAGGEWVWCSLRVPFRGKLSSP